MTINPGIILPFYDRITDQFRHKWGHQWGLIADVNKLLPFQIQMTGSLATSTYTFQLVKADGSEVVPWDALGNGMKAYNRVGGSETAQWLQWDGTVSTGVTLSCGLWYIRLDTGRAVYFSEVMDLQYLPDYEQARLVVSACTGPSGVFELSASDQAASGVVWEAIEWWNSDTEVWVNVGTDQANLSNSAPVGGGTHATILVRRKIKTAAGNLLTSYYSLYFSYTDPCTGYIFTESRVENFMAQSFLKKLTFGNEFDGQNILYSQNFLQSVWLNAYEGEPGENIERESQINGEGLQLFTSSNVKERKTIVCDEIPDFLVHPLSTFPGLATKVLKDIQTGSSWVPREADISFSNTEEGYFQRCTISFTTDTFFQSGCEENETVELVAFS